MVRACRAYYLLLAIILPLLSACDSTIHEYPEQEEPQEPLSDVTIVVNLDRSAPLGYKQLTVSDDGSVTEEDLPEVEMSLHDIGEGHDLQVIVKLFRGTIAQADEAELLDVETFILDTEEPNPSVDFTVQLPRGSYFCKAWAEYISNDESATTCFDASVLSSVYSDLDNYPADTRYRSAESGHESFTLVGNEEHRTIEFTLQRPLGRYRLVATDYERFVRARSSNADDIYAVIRYKQYIGIAYNVELDRLADYISSYRFVALPTWADELDGTGEQSIVGDYIFGEPDRDVYALCDIVFYDGNNQEINHYSNLLIPIRQNRETVIKGNFLTAKFAGDGGVNIDERFDDEYTVYI